MLGLAKVQVLPGKRRWPTVKRVWLLFSCMSDLFMKYQIDLHIHHSLDRFGPWFLVTHTLREFGVEPLFLCTLCGIYEPVCEV